MLTYATAFPSILEENFDAPSIMSPEIRKLIFDDFFVAYKGKGVDMGLIYVIVRKRDHTSSVTLGVAFNSKVFEKLDLSGTWIRLGLKWPKDAYLTQTEAQFRRSINAVDLWTGYFDTPGYWENQGMEIIQGAGFATGDWVTHYNEFISLPQLRGSL